MKDITMRLILCKMRLPNHTFKGGNINIDHAHSLSNADRRVWSVVIVDEHEQQKKTQNDT